MGVKKKLRKALCIQDEQLKGCDRGKDGDTGTPGMWGGVRGRALTNRWHLCAIEQALDVRREVLARVLGR